MRCSRIGFDREAYHFTEHEGRLRGSNPAQSYEMGFSDKGLEVGAHYDDDGGDASGSAYVFDARQNTGGSSLNLLLLLD